MSSVCLSSLVVFLGLRFTCLLMLKTQPRIRSRTILFKLFAVRIGKLPCGTKTMRFSSSARPGVNLHNDIFIIIINGKQSTKVKHLLRRAFTNISTIILATTTYSQQIHLCVSRLVCEARDANLMALSDQRNYMMIFLSLSTTWD